MLGFRLRFEGDPRLPECSRDNRMAEYKPTNPDQHFAQQRATRAAEYVAAASEAQQKTSEESKSTNERFYNSLALFSSGTVALSVTYLGYLKTSQSQFSIHARLWGVGLA